MKKIVLTAFLLAATCLLFAADGRIPIYTTTTISAAGSYYLTADTIGVVDIAADNVTFDLNGHTINFISSSGGGRNNITIKNGRISQSGQGIAFSAGVVNLTIDHVVLAGRITIGNTSVTPANIVIENCRAYWMSLSYVEGGRIANNHVEGSNQGSEIYLNYCKDVEVLHNIVQNTVNGAGILLSNCSACTVSYNTARNNGYEGIRLINSIGCIISHNDCTSNQVGVSVNASGSNQILYNHSTNNSSHGIALYGGSAVPFKGHDISFNDCSYNGGNGIYASDYISYNRFSNNVCNNNTLTGIGLWYSGVIGNTIDWNTCSGNTVNGIYLSSGSTGNVYSHNRCLGNTGANYSDLGTNTNVLYSVGNPTNY
jgi:parallel beta-helix repeat protein